MTRRKEVQDLLFFLKDESWYEFVPGGEYPFKLTDKAPKEARESYEKWKKQYK